MNDYIITSGEHEIKNRLRTIARYLQTRENKVSDFRNDKIWIKYREEQEKLYNLLKKVYVSYGKK